MTDFQEPNNDAGSEFDDLIGLNGPEAQAAAEARKEDMRSREVDEVLSRTGVSRDAVATAAAPAMDESDPMAVLQEANGSGVADTGPDVEAVFEPIVSSNLHAASYDSKALSTTVRFRSGAQHRYSGCPAELWEKFRAHFDGADGRSAGKFFNTFIKPLPSIRIEDWQEAPPADKTFEAVLETNGTAEKIVDDFVPGMGEILQKYEPSALAYGFPPAVDALITKAKLDATRTGLVLNAFRAAYVLAAKWQEKASAIVVKDENDTEAIAEAKELHRIVRDERINVENKRKAIKEPALRECQLIDGVANVYKDLLKPIESHLLAQAQFIENLEKERKEKVAAERATKLALFEFDSSQMQGLGDMSDENFEMFYTGVRERYHAKKRADEQAENERRERERLQEIENLRLREENQRLETERLAEAARTTEQRRIAEEAESKRKAAQDELDRQEAERKAEAARVAAEEERKRLAPDKEKLADFAQRMADLRNDIPVIDQKFEALLVDVKADLDSAIRRIQTVTTKL